MLLNTLYKDKIKFGIAFLFIICFIQQKNEKKLYEYESVSISKFYIYHLKRYRTNLRFTFYEY
jgi:hypothetical protein